MPQDGADYSSGEDGEEVPGDQQDNKGDKDLTGEEEYSDEPSDEEVSVKRVKTCKIVHKYFTFPQAPSEREELQKRIKALKKVRLDAVQRETLGP